MADQNPHLMDKLLGFLFQKPEEQVIEDRTLQEIVPNEPDDGASVISTGGVYGTYLDLDGTAKTEYELLARYRSMSILPEIEQAVDDILNESIVNTNNNESIVDIDFVGTGGKLEFDEKDKTVINRQIPGKIKNKIKAEFQYITELLDFKMVAYELFKRWYIDGRLYFQVLIDTADPQKGIKELRYIDPFKIKKVREVDKNISPEEIQKANLIGGLPQAKTKEYFMYSPSGFHHNNNQKNSGLATQPNNTFKINKDSIVYVTSGLMNEQRSMVLSYLHKSIRPLNQLRLVEDAMVIYRISRAPERRIFYVDVGNLPKHRAEQYMQELMNKYRNKLVYDASTGEVRDDRRYQTMLEDFWLPRMDGGRGTEISTLPGGQNLGEISDVEYFQNKLYKALNVPAGRLSADQAPAGLGRSTEINRDEVKFKKFVDRLRLRFSHLFFDLLKRQLILKGVVDEKGWNLIKSGISFRYKSDVHFEELQLMELMQDRMGVLSQVADWSGKYYSHQWIRKNILRQSDSDIEQINREIEMEEKDKQYSPEGEDEGGGFDDGGEMNEPGTPPPGNPVPEPGSEGDEPAPNPDDQENGSDEDIEATDKQIDVKVKDKVKK